MALPRARCLAEIGLPSANMLIVFTPAQKSLTGAGELLEAESKKTPFRDGHRRTNDSLVELCIQGK